MDQMLSVELATERAVDRCVGMSEEAVDEGFEVSVQALGMLTELENRMDQFDRNLSSLCQSFTSSSRELERESTNLPRSGQ